MRELPAGSALRQPGCRGSLPALPLPVEALGREWGGMQGERAGTAPSGCSSPRKGERGDAARRRAWGRPGDRCPWEATCKGRGSAAARRRVGLRGCCCRCPWDASCRTRAGRRCPWETVLSRPQPARSSMDLAAHPEPGAGSSPRRTGGRGGGGWAWGAWREVSSGVSDPPSPFS